ncbi:ATP-binding protein [Kribbella sp. NBC_00709]|uniref:ATP-binding protein n=1 Tax=Kribbella sp. NBC_00709 TaxID=2975972 RepID=UPI002E28EBEA|nr:ATP-binding protein [Kribbella sp. NBC_00709]
MDSWSENVPTEGAIELPPDPRALDAIGRNHSLETALADLVDNSIDAGATTVLIRFVRNHGRLRSLYVVDDGRGMAPDTIDAAMTVGGRRSYNAQDLGHFGLGLKAASFSQARCLTVMSRASGHAAVGRKWNLDRVSEVGFSCELVPSEFAAAELGKPWPHPLGERGTVIRWDDVAAFPASDNVEQTERFVDGKIAKICQHLGLIFHRFLENNRIQIDIDVHDVDEDLVGSPAPVTSLDPFAYGSSGRVDYPKVLRAELHGWRISFRCHLWPRRSSKPQFRLGGDGVKMQGLYFYRRDRLLQAGDWVGVHSDHPRLQLARVEVEIDNDIVGIFKMNPEKSRVLVGPEFAQLAASARAEDGTSLSDYLTVAEEVYRASTARSAERKAMIHPGSGLPPRVRKTIQQEIPELKGEDAIAIRWDLFPDDMFFYVDRDQRTLWLNKRYRTMLLGGKHGGLNDLPLLKSLLYLLVANTFEGDYFGPRDKDNIDLWQTILTAAVQAERR